MTQVAKGLQGLKSTMSVSDPDFCQHVPALPSDPEAGVDLRITLESC